MPRIYFNELMWRGSEISTSDEWIEIYNDTDEITDLSGWQVFDEEKQTVMVEISAGQIASHDYFLISNNNKSHEFSAGESILDIEPDVVDSKVSLSNSNLRLSLRNKAGEIVDLVGNGSKPFFGEYDSKIASMQRAVFEDGTLKTSWKATESKENLDAVTTSFATPRSSGAPQIEDVTLKKNSFEVGSDLNLQFSYLVTDQDDDLAETEVTLLLNGVEKYTQSKPFGKMEFSFQNPGVCPEVQIKFIDNKRLSAQRSFALSCFQNSNQIKFYEVLPRPREIDWNRDGSKNTKDEWIELVNFSQQEVDLDEWTIRDESGKMFEIKKQTIAAEGFLVIDSFVSRISMNDSGETLFLCNPSGDQIDLLKIPSSSSKADESFARWGDRWHWTVTPTPGLVNRISQPKTVKSLNPKDDIEGKKITLSGTIYDLDPVTVCLRVSNQNVEIKLKDSPSTLSVGQYVTVNATITNTSSPILIAASSDFIIKKKLPVKTGGGASSPGQVAESQTTTIIKIIKVNKKLSFKTKYRLNPIVLGSQNDKGMTSVNYQRFLLLFIGILSFVSITLVYDFYRRE